MRKLIALITISSLFSLGQMAAAGPFEDGLAAYERAD